MDWFIGLPTNSIRTKNELEHAFMERWGEKKTIDIYLSALSTTKRNENEIVEEFNKRFNKIVQKLHEDIRPPGRPSFYLDGVSGFSFEAKRSP
jgi:hypothetical protein